jgi:GxxExxY protein
LSCRENEAIIARVTEVSTDKRTDNRMPTKPHADLTYRIIGAAMKVHNRLGPGLNEAHYQRALSVEFRETDISFVAEEATQIHIDGSPIGLLYLDHLVEDVVIVEEKALSHLLTAEEVAQVVTYLGATGPRLAC